MASSTTPPPPVSGNGKYIAAVVVLGGAIAAMIGYKQCGAKPVVTVTVPSVAPTPTNTALDDVPLPPPEVPDAGPPPKPTATVGTAGDPCAVKSCSGKMTDELERALAFRAQAARKCYSNALSSDATLKGHVKLSVRIGNNGSVCAVNIAANDMGSPAVAQCAANMVRQGHFPVPKNGCIDTDVPLNFVPGH